MLVTFRHENQIIGIETGMKIWEEENMGKMCVRIIMVNILILAPVRGFSDKHVK